MADERYITQAQADAAKQKPIVHARPADAAARHRAVLRRRGPEAPRAAVRREGALRERPRRCTTTLDATLQEVGEPGARARAAAARQAARLPQGRSATSLAEGHTIDELQGRPLEPADRASATSCPPSCRPSASRRRAGARAAAHRPVLHADLARDGGSPGRAARRPPTSSSRATSIEVAVTKLDDGDAALRP